MLEELHPTTTRFPLRVAEGGDPYTSRTLAAVWNAPTLPRHCAGPGILFFQFRRTRKLRFGVHLTCSVLSLSEHKPEADLAMPWRVVLAADHAESVTAKRRIGHGESRRIERVEKFAADFEVPVLRELHSFGLLAWNRRERKACHRGRPLN